MSKEAPVTDHLNELNSTLTQLSFVGINFRKDCRVLTKKNGAYEAANVTEETINALTWVSIVLLNPRLWI